MGDSARGLSVKDEARPVRADPAPGLQKAAPKVTEGPCPTRAVIVSVLVRPRIKM